MKYHKNSRTERTLEKPFELDDDDNEDEDDEPADGTAAYVSSGWETSLSISHEIVRRIARHSLSFTAPLLHLFVNCASLRFSVSLSFFLSLFHFVFR